MKRPLGIYSAEAAFVMGFSLFSIFALIYLCFFIYDVQTLSNEEMIAAISVAEEKKDLEEAKEQIIKTADRLPGMTVSSVNVLEGATGEVTVSSKISFAIPLYATIYFKNKGEAEIVAERRPYRPQEFVRITEAAKEIFDSGS